MNKLLYIILALCFVIVAVFLFVKSNILTAGKTVSTPESEKEYFTRLLKLEADKRMKNPTYINRIEPMAEERGISIREAVLMRTLYDMRYSPPLPRYNGKSISPDLHGILLYEISEKTIQ